MAYIFITKKINKGVNMLDIYYDDEEKEIEIRCDLNVDFNHKNYINLSVITTGKQAIDSLKNMKFKVGIIKKYLEDIENEIKDKINER